MMTRDEAQKLRDAHDSAVKALDDKTRYQLAEIERRDLRKAGETRLMGGPVSRDELIAAILERRYPLAQQNEAIHVLHHAEAWPDCPFCQRQGG